MCSQRLKNISQTARQRKMASDRAERALRVSHQTEPQTRALEDNPGKLQLVVWGL
jgi:hypothetical protein